MQKDPKIDPESENSDLDLKALHKEALKQYKFCVDYWDPIYLDALNDVQFAGGAQWTEKSKKSRKARPMVTENKTSQFIDKTVSPVREEGLKIKLSPPDMSDIKDPKQAAQLKARVDLYQGRISDIEHQSRAIDAYVKGIEFACTGGIGFIRVLLLPNEDTGVPEITIQKCSYPFGNYLEPLDEGYPTYGFSTGKIDKDKYQEEYGKDSLAQLDASSTAERSWVEKDEVTVAEYFKIIKKKSTILILADGTEVVADETLTPEIMDSMPIRGTRSETKKQLFHGKMNGLEFIEHTVLDISCLPLVMVQGREVIKEHKKTLVGIVHFIRDAQNKYNFYASAEVEVIGLSPKATFMAAAQQIEPFKKIWNTITTSTIDVLPYDASPVNGVQLAPPQRLNMINQDFLALIEAKKAAFDDMKSNSGIYQIGLAEQQIDQSGKAILLREKAQTTNNNLYYFNLQQSVEQVARVIIEMLPMTFDAETPIQIRNEEGKPQKIQLQENPYTLTYKDVIISTGRNYDTRRTETADQLMSLISLLQPIVPEPKKLMEIAAILTKSLDITNADRISDILMGVDQSGQPVQDPAEMQADMQKMLEHAKVMQAHIDDLEKKLADKQADRELEMDKSIVEAKTKLAVEEIKIQGEIETAQGQIAQRAIAHGGKLIPELIPQESDIQMDVGPSVNQNTNQIVAGVEQQSDMAYENEPPAPEIPPNPPMGPPMQGPGA